MGRDWIGLHVVEGFSDHFAAASAAGAEVVLAALLAAGRAEAAAVPTARPADRLPQPSGCAGLRAVPHPPSSPHWTPQQQRAMEASVRQRLAASAEIKAAKASKRRRQRCSGGSAAQNTV